jgi:protoheme IX farnesyltransferase
MPASRTSVIRTLPALPAVTTLRDHLRSFLVLCKLRVNTLIVFTAMIGMLLAQSGWPTPGPFIAGTIGIALVAFAAAAINCLVERTADALMARTRHRPSARGEIGNVEILALAFLVGGAGLWILQAFVNPLTMWLTLATFLGYAVIYTLLLKPATPMNIVIGGASGAMPPVLGWAAMTGAVTMESLALFLIIFLWTPPHFWALAMARRDDYARAGFPMLPVTHGIEFTCLHSLLYVIMLAGASFLPVTLGMAGPLYGLAVCALNAQFIAMAWRLWRRYDDAASRAMFRYSIVYLSLLFAALFADRVLSPFMTSLLATWLPSL